MSTQNLSQPKLDLRYALRVGLIVGIITLAFCVLGMIKLFSERDIVAGVLSLGHILLFASAGVMGFIITRDMRNSPALVLVQGVFTGLVASIPVVILIILAHQFDLRQFMPNISPDLMTVLTFGMDLTIGTLLLVGLFGLISTLGASLHLLPENFRKILLQGLMWTLLIGLLSENLVNRLRDIFGQGLITLLFQSRAMKPITALLLFLAIVGVSYFVSQRGESFRERLNALPQEQKQRIRLTSIFAGILGLLLLPLILGTYLSEVVNNVGIFILMGLGLNIVVGFAGLLDLGYVAFFAIGAYTMAVLSSEGELGLLGLSFWAALPICVTVSTLAGIILGIPVLRMRGDYLAIVTLGFGEIIRILANSDFLKPLLGGGLGVLKIPKPEIAGFVMFQPESLYYVILAGCLLAVFISWRLRESRLGRQWMAMREDEDVAEAMGIHLVNVKLLAFGIGAAFSGMAGAIFASKLTSIFPHSFSLLISINVLCLIIVGGIASLPGVVVGALVLVGLPEMLREFKEYRLLMYGALLIVMMLVRPEGFIPSAIRKRELHAEENNYEIAATPSEAGD
jgi:branched-chain amino acid transport system permease protein